MGRLGQGRGTTELMNPLRPVLRLQLYLNVAGAHLSCPDELRQKVVRYFAVWSSGYALLGDFDDRLVIYGVDRALPRATKVLRIQIFGRTVVA